MLLEWDSKSKGNKSENRQSIFNYNISNQQRKQPRMKENLQNKKKIFASIQSNNCKFIWRTYKVLIKIKTWSFSLVTREIVKKNYSKLLFYFSYKGKKTKRNTSWREYGEREPFLLSVGTWTVIIKNVTEIRPSSPLLSTETKKRKFACWRGICIPMFLNWNLCPGNNFLKHAWAAHKWQFCWTPYRVSWSTLMRTTDQISSSTFTTTIFATAKKQNQFKCPLNDG